MQILRVSMNNRKVSFENLPEEWKYLGGSALIAKILSKEVPPPPDIMMDAGVAQNMGRKIKALKVKKVFLVTDPPIELIG